SVRSGTEAPDREGLHAGRSPVDRKLEGPFVDRDALSVRPRGQHEKESPGEEGTDEDGHRRLPWFEGSAGGGTASGFPAVRTPDRGCAVPRPAPRARPILRVRRSGLARAARFPASRDPISPRLMDFILPFRFRNAGE